MITSNQLIFAREDVFEKLQVIFRNKAVEAHVFGSIARGAPDAYSDIDIWFTFKDEEFAEVFDNRYTYYKNIGNIIHSCEAPQNAPIDGIHTALLIGSHDNTIITVVDIYLCPLSTATSIKDAKKLYGVDLPIGQYGFNPKKVQVGADYRIDFFIGFIFNTLKKIIRKEVGAFDAVLREYINLRENYNIPVEQLTCTEQNVTLLEEIMDNTLKVSIERQKQTIEVIRKFARNIFS